MNQRLRNRPRPRSHTSKTMMNGKSGSNATGRKGSRWEMVPMGKASKATMPARGPTTGTKLAFLGCRLIRQTMIPINWPNTSNDQNKNMKEATTHRAISIAAV